MHTLVLSYRVEGSGADPSGLELHLEPRLKRNGGQDEPWAPHHRLAGMEEVHAATREFYTALEAGSSAMGDALTDEDLELARGTVDAQLIPSGRRLRELLLPTELARRLVGSPEISHLLFEYDPRLNGVPVEGLFLGDDFVGFRYATGRRLWAQRPSGGGRPGPQVLSAPLPGFSVVDPGGMLGTSGTSTAAMGPSRDALLRDFEEFRMAHPGTGSARIDFGGADVAREVDAERMRWVLRSHRCLNVVGHHRYDFEHPERSGYVLSSEQRFTANDLVESLAGVEQPPALLCSIACEAGVTRGWERDWQTQSRLYGLVDAAQRAGIRYYVGTLTRIPLARSVRLLGPFYRAVETGFTVGEALRRARLALRLRGGDARDGGTVLGLAFLLYGDPDRALFCHGGHGVESADTVLCEAPMEAKDDPQAAGQCLRTVCRLEGEGWLERRCGAHRVKVATLRCSAGHAVASPQELRGCEGTEGALACANSVCPACVGYSLSRCWLHACEEGHPILQATARKTCRDPMRRHPDERRSVCPRDPGWIGGLCHECLGR